MKVLFTSISFLVLSLLLASCGGGGGSDKDSGSSGSKDKEGPASALTATAPTDPVGGASYNLAIVCNEAKEVVSITGKGLKPDPQTHTCTGSGAEEFSLSLKQGVHLPSPNNLSLSSMDEHGNSAGDTTIVNVPIDTVAPSVAITNGGDIIEGNDASFTITVTDDSDFIAFTPEVSSGSVTSGACLSSPCSVVVSGALAGTLTLTVAAGGVVDAAGNANTAEASDSLTVIATTLSVTSAPMGTSLNAASYPVSGNCVASQGTVTVTVETASPVMATCTGDPGNYTALLDISGVTANPLSVMVEQSGNTRSLSPSPANDQEGPASAPTATSPTVPVGDAYHDLPIVCNEAGEVVSITGSGLDPDSQTDTCTNSGAENFLLGIKQGVSFPSVNNLTLNSTDQYGNPAGSTTMVDVPIDTVAPSVSIANGGDIIEGNDANFTITVTNDSDFIAFTPEISSGSGSGSGSESGSESESGSVTSGACSNSPCSVVVSGASVGTLTLTVAVGDVVDAAGNVNTAEASDSLTVITTTLSVTSAPMGTSLNAASYPVSGNCDVGEGDVTVTVETASPVMATCTGDPAGAYTASLDISGVTAGSMSVMAEQGGRMASLSSSPANDQDGPASAPTATGPGSSNAISTLSYNLPIVCSEAAEVVSITGDGLNPDTQTHTCTASGPENFPLSIEGGENFSSPNNLTLNSMDQYGNPAGSTTTVNVPIDTSAIQPTVSIDNSLPDIDSSNAQSFTFEGSCSQEGEPVMVSVGALSPQTDPDCTGGLWSVSFDVTSLNEASINITAYHSSSSGVGTAQTSRSVTNSFICPTAFVAVPSLQGYTTNSFCVMKYEAKNDGSGNAISQAASLPYRSISRDDSITKCADIGSGYDLITNDEWQSIARNIELVGSNWKNGTVGDAEGLSTGHSSDGLSLNMLEASENDNEACKDTGDTCDGSTWHSQRRTHTLSNGEVTWDIAGNASEWVKDSTMTTDSYGPTAFISEITDTSPHSASGSLSGGTTITARKAKDQFGPSGSYINLSSTPYGGLGRAFINPISGGAVIRGGSRSTVENTGVFYVSLAGGNSATYVNDKLGFRCVYHP